MIKLWIANLGKYNEGHHVSEWITLPATTEEFEDLYVRIGVGYRDDLGEYMHGLETGWATYEEVFIADYETDMPIEISEYSNIEKLNEIALVVENLRENELEELTALCEAKDNFDEAWECYTARDFWYATGLRDNNDLGTYVVRNGLLTHEIPSVLENYIDYKAIGRDWEMNGQFTDRGFVYLYK